MCRWLAYFGDPIPIEALVFRRQHSLIDQSLHARQGATTTNGDGFGIGWYDQLGGMPGVYRSVHPAWNDRNLRELAEHISAPLFSRIFARRRGRLSRRRTRTLSATPLALHAQRAHS
jgi:predicted glutamine amidotransferase